MVIYVENPDKTDNPAFVEKAGMTHRQAQGLSDVIDYAVNSDKTQTVDEERPEILHSFVSGVNCHPSTARDEMIVVKKRFGKEDGTVAHHGYQSFAPGEATPELAHEIGVKLARRLWDERYQVLVATHLDRENHLHNHFVLNTVSLVDGLKYHRTEQDYHEMRAVSDALCRECGLSVIADPQWGKSKNYGEWRAEREGRPTWRGLVRADVDETVRAAMTERQFFDALRKKGYEVKVGKDRSVCPPGKERFVRLARNFGADYSPEGIRRRILEQASGTGPDGPQEVASMDDAKKAILRDIFWQMNMISSRTETTTSTEVVERDDGRGNTVETEVTVALSQLGNVGGDPYWSWYGFSAHVDWCACFVSW